MSVTEHLMRPGNGSINFTADLPLSVSADIMALIDENAGGIGAHVVITKARTNPAEFGDAAVLAAATYTGRITARPSRTSLGFEGLGSWLDTYLDSTVTRSAGTPTQWLGDLLTNSLTAGTVSGGSNVSKTFPAHITTRREALDVIAGLGGWEYRIMPDFTVDAGTSVFASPAVVVTRKAEGPDGALRGVDGSMIDQEIQVGALDTKAVALAEGQGTSIVKGTATTTRALRAPLGGAAAFVTVFSAPGEESANANTAASNFLNLQGMRRKVNVASSTHHLPRVVVPGDEVYIYDLAAGLMDTANQVHFRGETIFPATVRLLSYTWPIEQGCGVYIRSNAASGSATIIDVTDWVAWETGDTWWTVGDWAPSNYGRVNRSNPEVETRINGLGYDGDTYTPTLTNVTLGTGGTNTGRWHWTPGPSGESGTLFCSGDITLGTSGALTGQPTISLPSGFTTNGGELPASTVVMLDGATQYDGVLTGATSSTHAISAKAASGTYVTNTALSATVPFTFGNTDRIIWALEVLANRA